MFLKAKKGNEFGKNAVIGFLSQFIILALGILMPRLFLLSYGSETNGLITTVGQIFTYVALLEAGIGTATVNALYKPIINADKEQISEVYSASQIYYRKVTIVYSLLVLIVSFLYPLFINARLSYFTIMWVILLQGMTGVVGFYFSAAYKQVLIADGKNYIVSTVHLVIYILTTVGKVFLMLKGYNIIILQAVNFAIGCAQTLITVVIAKKKYGFIKKITKPDMSLLSQRNAFAVHQLSGVVFSSTDALVLSTFCNLKITSVYAVYNLVFHSLTNLINSIENGVNYILGHTFATGNMRKYISTHDIYESIYISVVFIIFTIAYMVILPFIKIYTRGVNDIQYIDKVLPLLFVVVQLLSCARATASRLITISGHAKYTQNRSIIEAIINLVSSIVLVKYIGIYGVLLGTILALLYRANDIIIYANIKILKRAPWITYKKMILNVIVFLVFVIVQHTLCDYVLNICNNYIILMAYSIGVGIVALVIYATVTILLNRDVEFIVKQYIVKLKSKFLKRTI